MLKLLVTMALVAGASAGPLGIKTCTSATVDVSCDAGYSLEATATCTACVMPAASVCGAGKEPTTAALACTVGKTDAFVTSTTAAVGGGCIACPDGKFAAASSADGCTACRTNAATCTSATADVTCKAGYSLEATATCTACTMPTATVCATGMEPTTAALACPAGTSTAFVIATSDGTRAAGGCITCPAGKFDHASVGCTACRTNAATCSSAVIDTACKEGFYLNSAASGGATCTACTAYAVADGVCKASGTLKLFKTAADLCAADNTLTDVPITTAAQACKACGVGTFANAAATAGCGACVQGDVALCTASATLKVLKTADDLCAAGNSETATPAVATAAAACKACPAGKFPNAAATAGCTDCDPAGTPAGEKASATSASVGAAALLVAAVAARFQ